MQLHCGTCFFTCSFLLLWTAAATADDVVMPGPEMESYDEERGKRPFCNAFTGCGKKRSGDVNPMAALMDLNAEPAVAELSRQILSEAKLWEAIQDARDELLWRQHKLQQSQASQPLPRNAVGLRSFRKRRSLSPLALLGLRRLGAGAGAGAVGSSE